MIITFIFLHNCWLCRCLCRIFVLGVKTFFSRSIIAIFPALMVNSHNSIMISKPLELSVNGNIDCLRHSLFSAMWYKNQRVCDSSRRTWLIMSGVNFVINLLFHASACESAPIASSVAGCLPPLYDFFYKQRSLSTSASALFSMLAHFPLQRCLGRCLYFVQISLIL